VAAHRLSQLISVPCAIGEQQQVLRIRRLGDQIEWVVGLTTGHDPA
jgi:hypothetical protein